LPVEKKQALSERGKRERLGRQRIIDTLFDALRQGGGIVAAVNAVGEARKTYGTRLVEEALQEPYDLFGAIGGHMIERGYLTMEHVTQLLRGHPKDPPDIFG
jgi:hypothetical protein